MIRTLIGLLGIIVGLLFTAFASFFGFLFYERYGRWRDTLDSGH